MAQFLKFDPIAKDYVFVNGSPVETDDLDHRGYYALAVPKNNWLYGAVDQGSFLYTLINQKRSASIEQRFASFAGQALNDQLVVQGYASSSNITNLQATPNGTSNLIQIKSNTSATPPQFDFVPV